MKWTVSDIVAVIAVVTNVFQAYSIFKKNQSDASLNQKLANQREKENDQRFKIENEKLKLEKEEKDAQLQAELDKLRLENNQKSLELFFPRSQKVFEQYIIEVRKVMQNIKSLPLNLSDNYRKLEALACLYCPDIYQNILNIDKQNHDYDHADPFYLTAYANETSYNKAMKKGIESNLQEIIDKINKHMLKQSQLSK